MGVEWAPQAEQDLIDIYLESARQFGMAQTERYVAGLTSCVDLLASMPAMGRVRTEIDPPVRVHSHACHLIVYRIAQNDVTVRIVHCRRDWERELQ